ncbi:MAG: hypothetical protein QW063_01655 [Candidatus Nanoarchaeia archaeon]
MKQTKNVLEQFAKNKRCRAGVELIKKHVSKEHLDSPLKQLVQETLEKYIHAIPDSDTVYEFASAAYLYQNVRLGDSYREKYLDLITMQAKIAKKQKPIELLELLVQFDKKYQEFMELGQTLISFVRENVGKKPDYIA